ncbi:MAG TPA: chemotaxis protein CheX [Candidatus Paceibacterota bacterium]|nr:chemotaxis protein CheX [Candidatus Paceibacterota bacterium]
MSQTLEITNILDFMKTHLVDVFETMLAIKATEALNAPAPHYADRVSGSVGFAGDTVNGAVYLHLSTPFANQAAAAMLGLPPEEIKNEAEVNDVVGEVTNMVAGGLKSWLCDAGADCAMSTPAIIRGTSFAIEPMPDVQHSFLVFNCGNEHVMVEIHVKFN